MRGEDEKGGKRLMSNRELAKSLIDKIPEDELLYVLAYLEKVFVPDETPNAETLEAMEEVNRMIADGSGEHFTGSTDDFFAMLAED